MGACQSKAKAYEDDLQNREEHALGPPSKTMDASQYAQQLVYLVSKTIEFHLGKEGTPFQCLLHVLT